MCGLSFSGKSTLAALLADELGAELLSLDAINAERRLYGGRASGLKSGHERTTSPRSVPRIRSDRVVPWLWTTPVLRGSSETVGGKSPWFPA